MSTGKKLENFIASLYRSDLPAHDDNLMNCLRILALAKKVSARALTKELILKGLENDPDREIFFQFYNKGLAADNSKDNSKND